MSNRNRTRRLRSSTVENAFTVDDEDAPSLDGGAISPDDSWVTVWEKLRAAGWMWKKGNNLYNYLYLKPGITSTKNRRQGIDYFVNIDHVKQYAMVKYGWSDKTTNVSDNESIKSSSTSSCSSDETNQLADVTELQTDEISSTKKISFEVKKKDDDEKSIISTKTKESSEAKNQKKFEIKNRSSVTVIKGSKSKPGLITFENQGDYRVGRNIAFLLNSKEGKEIKNYFGDEIPENAIETVTKNGKKRNYLVGVVDKKSKTKGRKDHYTVAWCYSCDVLHSIDLQVEIIDRGITQFLAMKNIKNVVNNNNIENEYDRVFSTEFVDKVLHKCDNDNNDGD